MNQRSDTVRSITLIIGSAFAAVLLTTLAMTQRKETAEQPREPAGLTRHVVVEGRAGTTQSIVVQGTRATGPVVFLDGVRFKAADVFVDAVRTDANLDDLTELDIEGVEIVKGTEAVSRYGESGRHGVILVRTRSPERDGSRD